jgi:hypothetical protein
VIFFIAEINVPVESRIYKRNLPNLRKIRDFLVTIDTDDGTIHGKDIFIG